MFSVFIRAFSELASRRLGAPGKRTHSEFVIDIQNGISACIYIYILSQASKCFTRDGFLSAAVLQHLKVLSAGLKTYEVPPDYSGNPFLCLLTAIKSSTPLIVIVLTNRSRRLDQLVGY